MGDDTDYKFVYLAYESYGLDINFTTSLISTSEKNWDNNYHKNLWLNGTIDKKSGTSIFYKKINTSEKVKMIKFLSASVDGKFSVSIKSGNNTYNNIKTVEVEYPGIYTIDLSNDNIVLDESKFSVTIESINDTYFVDNSISVFTSNVEKTPQINTENMDGSTIKVNSDDNYEFIVYSSTKNIPSNKEVIYSLFKDDIDYSNHIISTLNNRVAENNINATIVLNNSIPTGTYTLRISYDNNFFDSKLSIPSTHTLAGEGTEDSPYLIYTEDDLNQIRFNLDAYYLLKNDITLTENWIPLGNVSNPFRGGFDGGNHKIKGLVINQTGDEAVGFFGYVDAKYPYDMQMPVNLMYREKSYIRNITFENPKVSNDGMAGILIGKLTFNPSNPPENAFNIGSPTITIDNVHFIGGSVTSNSSDAGVIAANLNVIPKAFTKPYIYMSNIFSSTTISGYYSAGLVGFINDSFESGSGIMLEFDLRNFQNFGIIDQSNFNISYSDENNYSPVIGGIYGNVNIVLENYIINSIFNDHKYMTEFASNHSSSNSLYVLGSYDKKTSKNFRYKVFNGFYVSKFFTSSEVLRNFDFSRWADFDTYWKIENVDGIRRIPVLKNIDYKYKELPDEITLKLYEKKTLEEILNESLLYISYDVVNNDNIIDIEGIDANNDNHYEDFDVITKQKGQAIIHVINHFDGIEKDVVINVTADKVDKPIITYYYNGKHNNESYTQQVNALESFVLSKNHFVRAGFTFAGWNTIADGSGTFYSDEDIIASGIDENLRLYAQWNTKKYTLKFDANGGIGTMNDLTNISVEEDRNTRLPYNEFTRDNYKFIGWNTKADGSGISFANRGSISYEQMTSTSDTVMTLYAQWKINEYKITFNSNGGTKTMTPQELSYNVPTKLNKNTFTREGYTFTGWNTKADGTGTSYTDEQTISISSNITLYAQWKINKYKITFNSNGGTKTMAPQEVSYNASTKISKNTFERAGYAFTGWNTKADGTGTSYTDEQAISITSNITLYAQWKVPYVINKYGYDKNNNYINNIDINTTIDEYIQNIELVVGYTVDVDSKKIDNKQVLYTGGKTRVYKNQVLYAELTNVISGDTNGDGKINYLDYVNVYNHIQKTKHPEINKKLLVNEYLSAADMSKDNKISYLDYVKIYNKIKELKGGSN